MFPEYGRTIDKKKANEHFRLFIQIKERVVDRFKELLQADSPAMRYYCGRDRKVPIQEDLAYIFDKDSIKNILEMLANGSADGIAVFNGVRSQEDSRIGTSNDFTDVDGRPTVMIFPYKYQDLSKGVESDLVIQSDFGTEHPGTGGTGKMLNGQPSGKFELPELFTTDNIHKYV